MLCVSAMATNPGNVQEVMTVLGSFFLAAKTLSTTPNKRRVVQHNRNPIPTLLLTFLFAAFEIFYLLFEFSYLFFLVANGLKQAVQLLILNRCGVLFVHEL